MILYEVISHDDLYTLVDSNGRKSKLAEYELVHLMKNLTIGVRNMLLTPEYKLVERDGKLCKYTDYIALFKISIKCDSYIIVFDTESKRLNYLTIDEVYEKCLLGEININCEIEKDPLSNKKYTVGIPAIESNNRDRLDNLIYNFNNIVGGKILDNNIIFQAEQDCRDFILSNIDDIIIRKTDRGPMIDITSYMSNNNKLFNLRLKSNGGIDRLELKDSLVIIDSSYWDETIERISYCYDVISNRFKAGYSYYDTRLNMDKFFISYNLYTLRFEIVFYNESKSDTINIINAVGINTLELFRLSDIGIIVTIEDKIIEIFDKLHITDKVTSRHRDLDYELLNLIYEKFDTNIDYRSIHTLEELSFNYHTKYPIDKLIDLVNRYNSKFNLLRFSNPSVTGFELSIIDGKVIIDKIVTKLSNIDITIPDWVWGFGGSGILPDCVKSVRMKFNRPLVKSNLFYGCKHLEIVKLENLMIHISNTSNMFGNCKSLKSVYFDEAFDLRESKSTEFMFYYCENLKFKNIHSVNPFKISHKCIKAYLMFFGCFNLGEIDISDWKLKREIVNLNYLGIK